MRKFLLVCIMLLTLFGYLEYKNLNSRIVQVENKKSENEKSENEKSENEKSEDKSQYTFKKLSEYSDNIIEKIDFEENSNILVTFKDVINLKGIYNIETIYPNLDNMENGYKVLTVSSTGENKFFFSSSVGENKIIIKNEEQCGETFVYTNQKNITCEYSHYNRYTAGNHSNVLVYYFYIINETTKEIYVPDWILPTIQDEYNHLLENNFDISDDIENIKDIKRFDLFDAKNEIELYEENYDIREFSINILEHIINNVEDFAPEESEIYEDIEYIEETYNITPSEQLDMEKNNNNGLADNINQDSSTEEVKKYTVSELIELYNNMNKEEQEKYKQNKIEVSGVISNMEMYDEDIIIYMDGNNKYESVILKINPLEIQEELNIGDHVKIKGYVMDYNTGSLSMSKDSIIIKNEKE